VGTNPNIGGGGGGASGLDDQALGGGGGADGSEYEHRLSFHICTDQTVDIQVGDVVSPRVDSQGVSLRWGNGREIVTSLLVTEHVETACPQVRAECGSIWVRTPGRGSAFAVTEAAWTVVLGRGECDGPWSVLGSYEQLVEIQ
jgi:hypothetical protein